MRKSEMKRTLITKLNSESHKRVRLMGYVTNVRILKNVSFLSFQDRSGECQIVIDKDRHLPKARPGDFLQIDGLVIEDVTESQRKYEVQAKVISKLSGKTAGKVVRPKDLGNLSLHYELDHPEIALRLERSKRIFLLQSKLFGEISNFLRKRDCVEVKTPKIIATCLEGGAELFSVKYFEKEAALAQSPQLYHQILMAAFERVFEIGPSYRAEKYSTKRHVNEFTTLQVAISFIDNHFDLITFLEDLLCHIMKSCYSRSAPIFPRLSYKSCIDMVGKEFGAKLSTSIKQQIYYQMAEKTGSEFLFIHNLPCSLMAFNVMDENTFEARSFKLIFKGLEIASGSQRIHDAHMLRKRLSLYDLNLSGFASYLRAFQSGIPPHGGFCLGINRLNALLCGEDDIRRAVLFPRTPKRISP